jgi:hypothetical protein
MNKPKAASPEQARLERYQERYADDPLKYRLLMRLYGTRPKTITELAEPMRVHAADARKSLRTLVRDGLVTERNDGGTMIYSVATAPAPRWLVTELLRGAIESGGRA